MRTSHHAAHLFYSTPEQRIDLARRRFFEEGQRPSGLVSEAIIQSWSRCLGARRSPIERVAFDAVTQSRIHSSLARGRDILGAATVPFSELEQALAGTSCWALLIDATGVVLQVGGRRQTQDRDLLPTLARVGVNVSESVVGTNAPAIAAKTGQKCSVLGHEHFFETVAPLFCTAAPIRNEHGEVAAVLDLSSEGRPFGFDAEILAAQYAVSIENRLLVVRSTNHLVLGFHTAPQLLKSSYEALAAVDQTGRVVWMNEVAERWVGGREGSIEELFGVSLTDVLRLHRRDQPAPLRLLNGLSVWAYAILQASDGARQVWHRGDPHQGDPNQEHVSTGEANGAQQPAQPRTELPVAPTRLETANRSHIDSVLAECGGNVTRAARKLGVSRGLVYRHLKSRCNLEASGTSSDQ